MKINTTTRDCMWSCLSGISTCKGTSGFEEFQLEFDTQEKLPCKTCWSGLLLHCEQQQNYSTFLPGGKRLVLGVSLFVKKHSCLSACSCQYSGSTPQEISVHMVRFIDLFQQGSVNLLKQVTLRAKAEWCKQLRMRLLLGNQVQLTPALSQHCCFCFPDMLGTLRLVKCWKKREQGWLKN